jgi:large subunit ribosomal protein L28
LSCSGWERLDSAAALSNPAASNALKGVDHNGGLDAFLLKAKADLLSPRALDLKRAIEKKVGKPAPVAKAS